MGRQPPESMDDCLYFTNRALGEGSIIAWTPRPPCDSCDKGRMGKPIKDNGKVDKKADFYECPECKAQKTEKELAPIMEVEVIYTCPFCKHEGDTSTPYVRKSFKGKKAFVFLCEKCEKKIPITKKLADVKDLL